MNKIIHITESFKTPLLVEEDITDLSIIVSEKQVAKIYHKNIKNLKRLSIRVERAGILDYLAYHKDDSLNCEINASVAKDALLSLYTMASSSDKSIINQSIELVDQGAIVEVLNVFLFGQKSTVLSDVNIYHKHARTDSTITSYAIAKDEAKITINNNTTIQKGAVKSNAHQVAKGLNLHPSSIVVANPNLYIDENDVIAHHGAAIGSLNKDDLFYLMSRGLTEADASRIVVLGFLQPLLDKILDENLKIEIKTDFENKLK